MSETDPIDPLQDGEAMVIVGENGKTAIEELLKEYSKPLQTINRDTGEQTDYPSMAYHVQYYGEYKLQAEDVVSKEYNCFKTQPRHSLQAQMMEAIQATVNKLQATITVAAMMVTLRMTWFQIDPHDMYLPILRGC
ncbi:hypothetical protein EV421DRAFT_1729481 [Armillaria borealis]|uniref:Uncharacterized protein n=1 Tax=Armillaria borealis TaxID=47425 RepID=A0AA39K9P3_9AGAR|nr:hypothetical protein EV421DRAFT_1729481 [Armillaria borealis]